MKQLPRDPDVTVKPVAETSLEPLISSILFYWQRT